MFDNKLSSEEFIETFRDYPAYDNIRKIASVVDGLKNSSRKVVFYCLKHNIPKPVKTSQIKSQIENATEYLHGDITGVVETLAKNYIGTNNVNLLEPHGNFGTHLVKDSSASRYTFTKPSSHLYELFDKEDLIILNRQWFEGNEIEPVYLMPLLPLLLLNGSEGLSSGFAQKILNRDPETLVRALEKKLNGTNHKYKAKPFYAGFRGSIEEGAQEGQWLIKGIAEQENTSTVHIKAVPFTYDLQSYIKVLDKLEDSGVIKEYEDHSELEFEFVVKFTRDQLANYKTNDELLQALKLVKTITENYTVENENNRVMTFNNVNEILDYFIEVRVKFLEKKIAYKVESIQQELDMLNSKWIFVDGIVKETIKINNRPKKDIVADLDANDDIIRVDDSYDYLLNMNLSTLTEERIKKLKAEIAQLVKTHDYYKNITPNELYLDELKEYKN